MPAPGLGTITSSLPIGPGKTTSSLAIPNVRIFSYNYLEATITVIDNSGITYVFDANGLSTFTTSAANRTITVG